MNETTDSYTPENLVRQVSSGWDQFVDDLPQIAGRLLTAAVLIIVGLLALRLGRRIIDRAFHRRRKGKEVPVNSQAKTLQTLLTSVFNYILYFAIAVSVLGTLGVDVSSLLAVAGVGGVAIGFGCQTLVKDFISGMFLWMEGRMQVGDVVTVGDQTGVVENIALRTTELRSVDGVLHVIPNGDIRTVVNMSRDYRRALVDLPIRHGQPLPEILSALQDEMDALHQRLDNLQETPEVLGVIGVNRFTASVRIQCKCETDDVWALEREIRLAALNRMTKEGYRL